MEVKEAAPTGTAVSGAHRSREQVTAAYPAYRMEGGLVRDGRSRGD